MNTNTKIAVAGIVGAGVLVLIAWKMGLFDSKKQGLIVVVHKTNEIQ